MSENFSNQETIKTNENPAEAIASAIEAETLTENEISPERINALKSVENKIIELNSGNLKESFKSVEEIQKLGKDINFLSEISEKLGNFLGENAKEAIDSLKKVGEAFVLHAPEIIAGIATVGAAALAIAKNDPELGYASFRPEMLPGFVATVVTPILGLITGGVYLYRKMDQAGELDQKTE